MSNVVISDFSIEFNNPGTAGVVGKQKNFSLKLDQVKIIGLKFSVFWDNDEYYVVLVDNKGISYLLNSVFFDGDSYNKLREKFKMDFNIASFDPNYYKKGLSIITYPKSHYGIPLFERRISFVSKVFLFLKKLFLIKNPGWGYLSNESMTIIKQ